MPNLLAIVELGGYPNFTPLYQQAGYTVSVATHMRKALKLAKQLQPAVVVAEFNYQPDFRERVSNLESLLAMLATQPATRMLVFYEAQHRPQLDKLYTRFPRFDALPYPVEAQQVEQWLQGGEC